MVVTEWCNEVVELTVRETDFVKSVLKMTSVEVEQNLGYKPTETIFRCDVRFDSGKLMYVDIVAGNENPYCQAVLIDEVDSELIFSDRRADLFDSWQLTYKDKIYSVQIWAKE